MSEVTKAERFNLGFDAVQYKWFCDLESDLSVMRTLPESFLPRNVQWQSEKELAYIVAVAPPDIPFNLLSQDYIDKLRNERFMNDDEIDRDHLYRTYKGVKKRYKDIEKNIKGQCPDSFVSVYNSTPLITIDADEFINEVKKQKDKNLLVSRISSREPKLESSEDYSEYIRYLYNHYKAKDNTECWGKNEFILRKLYPSHFIAIHNGYVVIIEKNHDKFMKEIENRYHNKPILETYVSKKKIELGDIYIVDK